jgi:hypothetical protein
MPRRALIIRQHGSLSSSHGYAPQNSRFGTPSEAAGKGPATSRARLICVAGQIPGFGPRPTVNGSAAQARAANRPGSSDAAEYCCEPKLPISVKG